LERAGRRCSTLDLFGPGFTVLAGAQGAAWLAAARETSRRFGVSVDAHVIDGPDGWRDATGGFTQCYGVDPTGAVLVRPDGHVAFRRARATGDSTHDLNAAMACELAASPG